MAVPSQQRAFTVVELIVTMGIITILVGLLLPAVQAARESSRRMQCQSNVRQIALATLNHQTAFAHFPAGGYGYRWVGDSELGVGVRQPGGWIFSSLPFMEQQALFDRSRNSNNLQDPFAFQAPIPLLVCPSRGQSEPTKFWGQAPFHNAVTPVSSFKSDYAGNGGDRFFTNTPGPQNNAPSLRAWKSPQQSATGIFFACSWVRPSHISDGLSNTYLVAEKNVSLRTPQSAAERDPGNDQAAIIGDDHDIRRWCNELPRWDAAVASPDVFGSRHGTVWVAALADGSVQQVTFSIDLRVHQRRGNRSDGRVNE